MKKYYYQNQLVGEKRGTYRFVITYKSPVEGWVGVEFAKTENEANAKYEYERKEMDRTEEKFMTDIEYLSKDTPITWGIDENGDWCRCKEISKEQAKDEIRFAKELLDNLRNIRSTLRVVEADIVG